MDEIVRVRNYGVFVATNLFPLLKVFFKSNSFIPTDGSGRNSNVSSPLLRVQKNCQSVEVQNPTERQWIFPI